MGNAWQDHLLFAVKNEGINLEVLKAFFRKTAIRGVEELVLRHPIGTMSRRMWFLYEYLTGNRLSVEDVRQGGCVQLVDESCQVARRPPYLRAHAVGFAFRRDSTVGPFHHHSAAGFVV